MTPDRWSEGEFLVRLQEVGAQGYHHLHPFHIRMNTGDLDRDSIRLWVANRFYYQRNIPRKDAAILANCPVREVRQKWIKRIIDQDGAAGQVGGIEKWIRLGIACDQRSSPSNVTGLKRNIVEGPIAERQSRFPFVTFASFCSKFSLLPSVRRQRSSPSNVTGSNRNLSPASLLPRG
jgi:coenzyme PQQ biosynthesis protein C